MIAATCSSWLDGGKFGVFQAIKGDRTEPGNEVASSSDYFR